MSDLTSRLRNSDVTQVTPATTTSTMTTMNDARRRSMAASMKERSVIVILAVISIVFAACNIPQAICRILNIPARSKEVSFQVLDFLSPTTPSASPRPGTRLRKPDPRPHLERTPEWASEIRWSSFHKPIAGWVPRLNASSIKPRVSVGLTTITINVWPATLFQD